LTLNKFYKNKKILITGHTGFKGIWLSNVLIYLGAKVYGISKNDANIKNFKNLCKTNKLKSYIFDILNKKKLNKIIKYIEPEIIFHLAAQSIVRTSYQYPEITFETNFNGTLNLLSVATKLKKLKSIIIVTSDKCYKNQNKKNYFVETDSLGGDDPYSASKAASEILFHSFLKSFFYKKKIGAATARAGNVIGGGDWSKDRIIPDCARCISKKKKITIRNPNSTRPWQHVLDVINGYLILGQMLFRRQKKYSGNWNFGPKNKKNLNVRNLIILFLQFMKKKNKLFFLKQNKKESESKFLRINSSKANNLLKWKSKYNIKTTLQLTADWYHENLNNKYNNHTMEKQIKNFFKFK
jgi:CDP-glucose 4,6-dehydratase